eukprot:SAG31_NODE_3078_length_4708_cov_1.870471_2_plen_61_part_00
MTNKLNVDCADTTFLMRAFHGLEICSMEAIASLRFIFLCPGIVKTLAWISIGDLKFEFVP